MENIMDLLFQKVQPKGILRLRRPGPALPAMHSRTALSAALEQEQEKSLVWILQKRLPH